MNKLYLLAHPADRLRCDFFPCGTHIFNPQCGTCAGNQNGWEPPLLYFWEFEFGDPQDSLDLGHHCFWGAFQLMVTEEGRSLLETLRMPFKYHPTQIKKGDTLRGLSPEASPFHFVTTLCTAAADVIASDNEVCAECGQFTKRRRPLTRLRIPEQNIPPGGIFTIEQSGIFSPLFVTEDGRNLLTKLGLTGVGFYPAGRVV